MFKKNQLEAREFLVKTNKERGKHLRNFAARIIPYVKTIVKIVDYVYKNSKQYDMLGVPRCVLVVLLDCNAKSSIGNLWNILLGNWSEKGILDSLDNN